MVFKISKLASYTMPLLATTLVVGCIDDDDKDKLKDDIDVIVDDTVDDINGDDKAKFVTLNYLRKDGNYKDWGVHAFNQSCTGVKTATEWSAPVEPTSIDDKTGAAYQIEVKTGEECINYIIHKGDEKEVGGDRSWQLADGSSFYVVQGKAEADDEPVALSIYDGEKAIFIDETTIAIPGSFDLSADYALRYSTTADIAYDDELKTVSGGKSIALTVGELSEATKAKYRHLSDYKALTLDLGDMDLKTLLKGQINVTASLDGTVYDATGLQLAPVLDAVYAKDAVSEPLGAIVTGEETVFKLWAPTAQSVKVYVENEDAPVTLEEAANGVWSSPAISGLKNKYYQYEVTVYYPQNKQIETHRTTDPYSLNLDTNSVYSQVIDLSDSDLKPAGWDGHSVPTLERVEQHIIYETHLRDLSVNDGETGSDKYDGKYMAITESDRHSVKQLESLAAAGMNTIHLLNVFDIATVNEDESKRVDLTNTVQEFCAPAINPNAQICTDMAGSSKTLAEVLAGYDPALGAVESAETESAPARKAETAPAQALMNDLRAFDSFNWGYDPYHYGALEGSYSTKPEDTTRIVEYRTLVKTLHDMGYRVVMDVVYNHTNEGGLGEKSVLDKIVPGYYQRLNASGGIESSTCCSNTATENTMMGKLMTDTLVTWAEQYKIDGFRFDLMGHQPKDLMVKTLQEVEAIDPDTYFYGEGWNFGEVQNNARFIQASQFEMAGTGIGTYSDRLRDAMRGGSPFDSQDQIRMNQGFANAAVWNEMVEKKGVPTDDSAPAADAVTGEERAIADLLHAGDLIRLGLAGNLKFFTLLDSKGETRRGQDIDYNGQAAGYTLDPQENISYVSKHDNQTLWDNNMYKAATELSSAERARMQIIALSTPLLGQGLPFMHLGSELLRSKSMQRDSYDSGDWFNAVKFDMSESNWNVGLPRADKDRDNWELIKKIIADPNAEPTADDIVWTDTRFKELLKVRSGSPLFTLATADEIKSRVDFWNTGAEQTPGLIVMSIDDGQSAGEDLDPAADAIVVVINATNSEQTTAIADATGFSLHSELAEADASFADGEFTVAPLTVAVFVQAQADTQGAGLPVNKADKDFTNIPPLEFTPYVTGTSEAEMGFVSDGEYQAIVELEEGAFEFNLADENGLNVIDVADVTGSSLAISNDSGLFGLDIVTAGNYLITLNAKNADELKVNVELAPDLPTFGVTELYLRGSISDAAWAAIPAAKFSYAGNDVYELTFEVGAAASEMKVADAAWSAATNFGVVAASALALDAPITLVAGGNSNIAVELPAGTYLFSLDVSNNAAPVLTVSAE